MDQDDGLAFVDDIICGPFEGVLAVFVSVILLLAVEHYQCLLDHFLLFAKRDLLFATNSLDHIQ